MATRLVGRCEGCQGEIVVAQEKAESELTDHLSTAELQSFLQTHEACRAKVARGPFFTLHAWDE